MFGQTQTYIDNFSLVSYTNNDGTHFFSNSWTEFSDDNSPSSGYVRVNSDRLRLNYLWTEGVYRNLSIPTNANAVFTCDFTVNSLEAGEVLDVQLWNASTDDWETIASIDNSSTSPGTIAYTLETNHKSASAGVRFINGGANWSGNNDVVFIDNVKFEVTLSPPSITATGNQDFCLSSGNPIPIAETVGISGSGTGTSDVYVQISSGYVNGEDLLTLTGSHTGISSSWDAIQGKLTLSGSPTASYAQFESAILDVEYSNSNLSATGSRNFSITVGNASYLPSTGHYYEYVPSPLITWTQARDAAALRTYFGLEGYLATLTAADEGTFAGTQSIGVGWIGGTDTHTEGVWRWVTGPEGLENGGLGRQFWQGASGGANTAPDFYDFWNSGEPNNVGSGGEDYAHITHANVGPPGSWNDLPNVTSTSGNYMSQGYVVEYGGMPGDPTLQISASTTIELKTNPTISLSSAIGSDAQILCNNTAINNITYLVDNGTGASITAGLLPTGVVVNYSGGIFTISGTPSVSGIFPYIITATGDCGNVQISGDITVDSQPVINNPGNQFGCGGYALPTITGTNLSGNEAYYTGTSGGGIKYNAGDEITSTIALYVYDINGVCSDEESFDVTVNSEPVINIVTASKTTCVTSSNGEIYVSNITVGAGTIEYSIDDVNWQSSNSFSGLSSGNYNVKVRTEIGGKYCVSASKTVSVDTPTAISINQSNKVDASCSLNTDGEIEMSVSGGDQSIHFDAADSYVALDLNYNSTTAIPEMTVAAWVKVGPGSGAGGWSILDFDRSEYFNFTIGGLNASDVYHVSFNTRSPSGGIKDFNSVATIGDDQWHFVVGVYDGTNKYIYIDGVLDNTDANPHSGSAIGSANTRYGFIGAGSEASTYNGAKNGGRIFDGGIADIWYFESSITDAGDLIGLGTGIVPVGHAPIGHWRLNDNGDDFIPNLANPNSYGELFGMADASNISTASLYTFTCTKNGTAFNLDGIISEESTNNYKLSNLGIGDYVLTATNNNGCSKNTSFTIANGDVTPPVISVVPSDVTECASNIITQTAIVSGIGLPLANYSDNCGGILTVQYQIEDKDGVMLVGFGTGSDASGFEFPEGSNTVTYKVTDEVDLSTEKNFKVIIEKKPTPVGIYHE